MTQRRHVQHRSDRGQQRLECRVVAADARPLALRVGDPLRTPGGASAVPDQAQPFLGDAHLGFGRALVREPALVVPAPDHDVALAHRTDDPVDDRVARVVVQHHEPALCVGDHRQVHLDRIAPVQRHPDEPRDRGRDEEIHRPHGVLLEHGDVVARLHAAGHQALREAHAAIPARVEAVLGAVRGDRDVAAERPATVREEIPDVHRTTEVPARSPRPPVPHSIVAIRASSGTIARRAAIDVDSGALRPFTTCAAEASSSPPVRRPLLRCP